MRLHSRSDNCPIAVIAAEGPVVDANYGQGFFPELSAAAYHPQQRVIAHRQHQSLGEMRTRSSAKCQTKMMDNALQPRCPARSCRQHSTIKAFSKYPPSAMLNGTNKPARYNVKLDHATRAGKIRYLPDITAMNAS